MSKDTSGEPTAVKDYDAFEGFVVSMFSTHMPNLNWVRTGATRDGNKDATSFFESTYSKGVCEAWLEIKHKSKPTQNISSRAFDSTLVSALQAGDLKALYFATNACVNTNLHFRISSFHDKALPNLSTLRIYDGGALDDMESGLILSKVGDLIFDGVTISDCIDYANHQLADMKTISTESFYYVIIPIFNPYLGEEEDSIKVYNRKVFVKEKLLIGGWNFLSFRYKPSLLDAKSGVLNLTVEYGGKKRILEKNLNVTTINSPSLFYDQGFELTNTIFEYRNKIENGSIRRFLSVIEGCSGTGKTYIVEEVCASWSSTHEIFPILFSGLEHSDWDYLERLIDFSFNNGIIREKEKVNIGANTDIEFEYRSRLSNMSVRVKKLLLIDDWHKASQVVRLKILEIINILVKKSECVSVIIFTRPHIDTEHLNETLSFFDHYRLLGPTKNDVKNNLESTLSSPPSEEELNFVFEICPNLVCLKVVLDILVKHVDRETNIHEILTNKDSNQLLKLPALTKNEYDLVVLIYSLPNGLSRKEIELLPLGDEVLYNLQTNSLIKTYNYNGIFYIAAHDLWRDAVLSNRKMITKEVLNFLDILSKHDKTRKYTCLAAGLKSSESLGSSAFQDARVERDICVKETRFNDVRYLAESIVSSIHHSEDFLDRISDSHTAYIIASDYLVTGDILNHCSHKTNAMEMLEKGLLVCKKFLHDDKVYSQYMLIRAQIVNLMYWSFDCRFLSKSVDFTHTLDRDRNIALSIIQNRTMMARYLLDEVDSARKVRRRSMNYCGKSELVNERIHLIMDSAKNEMIYSVSRSLKMYSRAIKEYTNFGEETRRVLVAKAQRESLKIKTGTGTGSVRKLKLHIKEIKKGGYFQEYMNSLIDLATIYAVHGEREMSSSCLNEISGHTDIVLNKRVSFKFNQCRAILAELSQNNSDAINYWKKVQSAVSELGDSYKLIPLHNIKQKSGSRMKWFFDIDTLHADIFYIDPRIW